MTQRRYQVHRRQQRPRSPWAAMLIPFLAILITAGLVYIFFDRMATTVEPTPAPASAVAAATELPPTSTPEPLPTDTPEPSPTPESPTPTPLPPVDVLRVGSEATVNAESGLRARSGPGTNFDPVTTLPAGTIVEVIDGPQRADTYTWWQIRFPSEDGGTGEGWVAGDFLDPGAG